MAHSIQVVNDKVQIVGDRELLALVSLIDAAVEARVAASTALRDLVSRWQRELASYGPGTINLHLDTVGSSPELRDQLRSALAGVKAEIEALEPRVPAARLTERCRAPGVQFMDFPSHDLVAAITQLEQLLA